MKLTIALLSTAVAALAPMFLTPDTPAPAFARTWNCPSGQLVIESNGKVRYLADGLPATQGQSAGHGAAARLTLINARAPMPSTAVLRTTANQLLIESNTGEAQLCRAAQSRVVVRPAMNPVS